ncbi:MAG TPA: helix-turn-helix domain-containing protein [Pyrinomonadaceae bacterium]|nr:helix-turn-helix domain-containing protein [Pyrinomonadaceae bacterium]
MSTAKAAIIESLSKPKLRGLPSRARKAPATERLEKIKEMAAALLDEAESLDHENALAEASVTVNNLTNKTAVDFHEEVRRFEMRLISRALELTGGNQARAARLLRLGATTLNYKIKVYELR